MNEAVHSMQELSNDGESPSGPKGNDARELAYRWLLPSRRHPYYIVAPPYTQRSAGVKSLHMLCNALNRAGERAYILASSGSPKVINPTLLTPLLTQDIIDHDYEAGLTPITVYPEVVSGNPYNAPFVVRYVLNYPRLLGGDEVYSEDEFCITYSNELASAVPNTRLTLFVPVSDPHVFTPEPRVEKRSGRCFYAAKYREDHDGKLFEITRDSVEIYRDLERAQTPEQIADLFRRSEVFYTYENTALAIEALMCECPVVFLPNDHLTNSIGAKELGWDGIAWGADEAEIARAKATVKQGRENYLRLFDEFVRVLPEFIEQTQKEAAAKQYETPIGARVSHKGTTVHVVLLSHESPDWACAQIRVLAPFRQLGNEFELECAIQEVEPGKWSLNLDFKRLAEADLILVQRFLPGAETMEDLRAVKALRKPVVCEVDDLITDLPESNPHYHYARVRKPFIEQFMRDADAIVVSTEVLADTYTKLNPNVYVLPNYLDDKLWSGAEYTRDDDVAPIRILFAGTPTHAEDLELILPALERLKAEYADAIQFVFMGLSPFKNHRLGSVELIGFQPDYPAYAAILKRTAVDLAVVPLVDNPFNRAKSAIKWLEYSSLGLPGVFSDLPPYEVIEHGVTGLRVPNTTDAWYDAIDALIRLPALRRRIGLAAREEVYRRWTVSSRADDIAKTYRIILKKSEGRGEDGTASSSSLATAQQPALPWLPEARCLPQERDWAQEVLQAWKREGWVPPRIALAVIAASDERTQATQQSLDAQWLSGDAITVEEKGEELLAAINHQVLDANADWLGFIDAGDQLAPDALFRVAHALREHPEWQVVYTDEDSLTPDGQHVNPHCKPDFNIDYLRSLPYIGGLMLIKKELFAELGGFDPTADGAEDYDLILRAWEKIGDAGIGHIPEVLYHRLQGGGHCSKSVEEIIQVSQSVLQGHLQRLGIAAEVTPGPFPPSTRVRYSLHEKPLVSIIIPTRNQLGYLQRCVESLIEKTQYPAYEILIIDNDSDDAEARTYLDMLAAQEEQLGGRLRVLRHPGPFNFSAMNNRAVEQARGDYLLLLNNDTAALHEDWLDEMMSHALRPEVGVVGAKLLFPDGKIQHAGVILGMRGPAEHPFIGQPPEYRGYFGRAMLTQNLSAVTGACLLISKALYQELGGLDEQRFQVSYNDIDLCLKVREAGHKIVFTPWAMLLHEGSASQRGEVEKKPNPEKEKRFASEKIAFYQKWLPQLAFDPAYNRHLSLASTDFLLEDQAALTWDPEWRPRPRILVHPADREGCGEYRIISPMRALQKAGRAQGWETMRIFEPAEMARFSPESIVLQRQMEWPQIEALERHKKLLKTFRVFEIDDLITNLPVKSLHKAQIHKDIAKRFRKAAGLCNRLVVATEPLAKAYQGFSDEVRVQPNCIEDAIWGVLQPKRRGGSKPRVGWAGGVGHTGDLEMIADVVRDLADEVDWVFFGLCPDALRPYVREFHTGVPLTQYPAKLASLDLDLALAPLENNAFNEAKSHLRILEYGILGYPLIASDIFPYQGDFPVTLVANRYRDWVRAIREQIADRQALAAAGDRLREHVRAHWLLEEHLDDWLTAWLP